MWQLLRAGAADVPADRETPTGRGDVLSSCEETVAKTQRCPSKCTRYKSEKKKIFWVCMTPVSRAVWPANIANMWIFSEKRAIYIHKN